MSRLMKASLFGGLISILVLVAIILGCSDDIVLEPLPSLLGDYEGEFWYTADYGLETERPPRKYPVTWRFTDHTWNCWDASAEGEDCICDPSGDYNMADGVELTMREDGCAGCVFDSLKLPQGVFTLKQPPDPRTGLDSVVLTQIVGNIRKDVLLVPVEE